jgi:hypothetical protein
MPNGSAIRRRNLRFDLNSLADFEQEVGMGFAQLMSTRAIFATARALLWAGLKHEQRGLTVEDVGDLLGRFMQEGGDLTNALQAAFQAAVEQGALGSPDAPASAPSPNVPMPAVVPAIVPVVPVEANEIEPIAGSNG